MEESAAENSNFKLTKLFPILLESTNIYPNSSQIFSSLSSDNDEIRAVTISDFHKQEN